MKLGRPDASGRRRPEPVKDSDYVIDADTVILAIGQSADLKGVPLTDGKITTDEWLRTDIPVYLPAAMSCSARQRSLTQWLRVTWRPKRLTRACAASNCQKSPKKTCSWRKARVRM